MLNARQLRMIITMQDESMLSQMLQGAVTVQQMFQSSIQAHIIGAAAIVDVYLTLSIVHFLNDASSGGRGMRAGWEQHCVAHVKTGISVVAECGCEYQTLCGCFYAFPAVFDNGNRGVRKAPHPRTNLRSQWNSHRSPYFIFFIDIFIKRNMLCLKLLCIKITIF